LEHQKVQQFYKEKLIKVNHPINKNERNSGGVKTQLEVSWFDKQAEHLLKAKDVMKGSEYIGIILG
jgi:hypothetical protein